MTRFVTVPAVVVPLLYSGVELVVWGLDGELEEAFPARSTDPTWYEGPLDRLDRACEFLRVIDWPRSGPPVEATVDIDRWREVLLAGLDEELRALYDHRDAPGNSPELREESRRAIAAIDGFLADLPALEAKAAEEAKPVVPYDDPYTAERGIVLQVLRDDHDERWSRGELAGVLHDVEAQAVSAALESLRQAGAVHLSGGLVWASRCARRLSDLGMVSI
jgi:hypothetical protein